MSIKPATSTQVTTSPIRPLEGFWHRAFRTPALIIGVVILATVLLAAVFAPDLAPYDPAAQNLLGGLQPPNSEHLLGTDQLGRDILSRIIYAARTNMQIAVGAALFPFVVGVTIGMVSGYFGGIIDWILSRIVDTIIAFPFYVLVIALVFAIGTGARGIVVAFAIVGWIPYARVIRVQARAMAQLGWVRAARGGGISHLRILRRHILPNVLPQAIVLFMTEITLIMVAVVTLGYLGLGIQPPTPDWGTMIYEGQSFVTTKWWLSAIPGLAVVYTGIGLSLIADGLGDVWRIK